MLLLGFAGTLRVVPAPGQAVAAEAPPIDLTDPAVIEAGEKLYLQSCRGCHGKDGQGGRGPALRGRGFDSRYAFDLITRGSPAMPAFNQLYTPEQVWHIVAFVQLLRQEKQ